MTINQYLVVLVKLNPTVGSEASKTRPCVVISPDEMNNHLDTVVVAPMTSTPRSYPSRVSVVTGGQSGWVMLDQIRTVDRSRITKTFQFLSEDEIDALKAVLKELYVD
jgi:mRNA interferase MazF